MMSSNISKTIDTPHLRTRETPRKIMEEDYPRHPWPISGGWRYDESDLCVIELDTEEEGVAFEHEFILYRTYEELIVFRPKGEGYAGINVKAGMQALMNKDGRHYDRVEYTVTAFPETDWNALKEDWESHCGYKGDPEGGLKHLMLRQSKIVTFKTVGYFDISRFFGKRDRSLFAK